LAIGVNTTKTKSLQMLWKI